MKSIIKNSMDHSRPLSKRSATSIQKLLKLKPPKISKPGYAENAMKSERYGALTSNDIRMNNFFKDGKPKDKGNRRYNSSKKKESLTVRQDFLLKKSDKMKLVYWNRQVKVQGKTVVVISADTIVNQDSFWEADMKIKHQQLCKGNNKTFQSLKSNNTKNSAQLISPNHIKDWKNLHSCNYFIIWIIRKKNTFAKLVNFSVTHKLPLHAIFYIRKKRNYTVDYTPIEKQLIKIRNIESSNNENKPSNEISIEKKQKVEEEIHVFETVKINLKNQAIYESYQSRIPILTSNSKVYLIRVEQEPGLAHIYSALDKSYNPKKCTTSRKIVNNFSQYKISAAIKGYISRYIVSSHLQKEQKQEQEQYFEYDEELVQEMIEKYKRRLIDELIQVHGKAYQFQNNTSIYYYVGQMLKRNYKIFYNRAVDQLWQQTQQKKKKLIKKQRCIGEYERIQKESCVTNVQYFQIWAKEY